MVRLVGNYFVGDDVDNSASIVCSYCDKIAPTTMKYDYCFHCNCFLCRDCQTEYESYDVKKNWLCVQREEVAAKVTSQEQLASECGSKKSILVLFYLEGSSSSQHFKDSLIYHQCKLMMQPGKFVPNIGIANYSQAGVKAICNSLKITEFPTLILFNQQAQPIRTLIGYSWLEVPFFYQTQKRLLEEKSIEIQLYCTGCEAQYNPLKIATIIEIQAKTFIFCLKCFSLNKPTSLPQKYQNLGCVCSFGHFRCISCSYAALDVPTTFKDPTGEPYLWEKIVTPKLKHCPKNHTPILSKINTFEGWQYQCYGCSQKKFFDDQHGVGMCSQCKLGLCPKCMGYNEYSLQELKKMNGLAFHYVESTAEEGTLCSCTRHFKKAYKTRQLSMEQFFDDKKGENKPWKCLLCQEFRDQGDLHIGCFFCPSISMLMDTKANFQVCMKCATKTGLLMREPLQKVKEESSYFICSNGHQTVKTSMAYEQQLTFNCIHCKKKYFENTEKIYCKTCKSKCCLNCIDKLINASPPKCNQLCKNGHNLSLQYSVKNLMF